MKWRNMTLLKCTCFSRGDKIDNRRQERNSLYIISKMQVWGEFTCTDVKQKMVMLGMYLNVKYGCCIYMEPGLGYHCYCRCPSTWWSCEFRSLFLFLCMDGYSFSKALQMWARHSPLLFFFFNLDFEKFVYYQAHYGNMHLGAATTHSGLVTSYGDTDLGQYWLSPKFLYYMADS